MRVVYLHQYFATPDMATGTRSYEFARRLVRDGHEVHMITSDRKGGPRRTEDIEGIQVTWIPVSYSQKMSAARRVLSFFLFAILASLEGVKKKPTVLFATSTPLTIIIPAFVIKVIRRVPMVFEVRDPWPEMLVGMGVLTNPILVWGAERLKKFAYFNSVQIIALSDGMKDTIIASGYEANRITVIPNASDTKRFQVNSGLAIRKRYTWLGDRKKYLYVGSMGNANSAGYMVELAAAVKPIDPEIRFVIVGKGAEEEKIRSKGRRTGVLNDNFFMLPPIPKRDVPALFAAASISTVLLRDVPELWTNSSNKFFDSLASGRPVVVNNVGWQQQILEESNAGFHIHPSDIPSAAVRIVEALHNDGWLVEAGRNARQLAETSFDIDLLYQKFQQVLTRASEKNTR